MMCPNCKKSIIPKDIIQENKEDYWLCNCGDFHLGFPYNCPKKELRRLKDSLNR